MFYENKVGSGAVKEEERLRILAETDLLIEQTTKRLEKKETLIKCDGTRNLTEV